MIWIGLALLILVLSSVRFVRRARQEANRQRVLTWPRAVAVLPEGEDRLGTAEANHLGETTFYKAELERSYVFYARGEKYSGKRLAPKLDLLNVDEAKVFLKGLSQCRKYEVYFNPDRPEENYLTIGKPILGYGKLWLFLVYGLLLPGVLLWFGTEGPDTQKLVVLFVVAVVVVLLLLVVYFLAQPVFDLGKLLLPVTSTDRVRNEGNTTTEDKLLNRLEDRPLRLTDPEKLLQKKNRSRDPL
ncbi:hypothetical protein CLV84_1191 [Neolewinella xylanilytica]|uniref:DUF3592 domain-containing protein n=1 Tax=Neolewinella xylanilytica TaxID=1514080 RepID=A0A2S6I9P7_9BACT|nr:hypothetical protein [Neolewinella xylanilytica]PPK88226.1 hypothetical protein CLV84_1191 [Neolewinella xylanilytica]